MWKNLILALALAASATAQAQTKKELAQTVVRLQQPAIENISRSIVERPAMQIMQAAFSALQTQVAADKREAVGKAVEADVKAFVDESVPLLRERALKLAPSTVGTMMEEKFSEDELKQLAAWLESPVYKKFQQFGPEIQNAFAQKLVAEAGPLLDPKLQALQQKVRKTLGMPATKPDAASAAKPAAAKPKAATSATKPAASAPTSPAK